jgi:hypothetical protein
MFFRFMQH